MNESQIYETIIGMQHSDVTISFISDYLIDADPEEIPFPNCKIMEVTHHEFFALLPHTPRYFELEGDKLLNRGSMIEPEDEYRTCWLPLTPHDDWAAVLWKADKLAVMSGDRHHRHLEGFGVVGDILMPHFGS